MTGLTLSQILSKLEIYELHGPSDLFIRGIADDSRKSVPGGLFICLAGERTSGYDYIDQVCDKGATALLVDRPGVSAPGGVTVITVPDAREAMKKIAPYFYGYPALDMKLYGVTGTNGKTTVTYMLKRIADAWGKKSGVIGTIDTVIGERRIPSRNTTPDVMELQSLLSAMREEKVEYAFMEVSSHALALGRIAGCEFDLALLTNVTQDHLDFHKNFAAYIEAKTLLFSGLAHNGRKAGQAVINREDKNADIFLGAIKVPVLCYGFSPENDVYPKRQELSAKGMKLLLATPAGELPLSLATTGHFNVSNVMAAVTAALAGGAPPEKVVAGLDGFKGVAGRFELVEAGQPFTVIVDYAHTPDGLENILKSARRITDGQLITVFGCGGNRDKAKRPLMGKIASEISDFVYITSDNPRKEEPEAIIGDIMAGVEKTGRCRLITERAAAIETALESAKDGDVVVVAGKGHETYQILGDRVIDFDDRIVAGDFLRRMRQCSK
ncbi:MAG: UDP-N-acetylmuramoyl-L-alanyl-D-glutamate--2,6-diaminopimelate ligase [Acidaminococcales bacterium]|nr:UDP-N-acetylmuramoyl-L-alanyl-D-glutamate--2,6-diaminopimelate ligase [Acidaminococcales bacterium]